MNKIHIVLVLSEHTCRVLEGHHYTDRKLRFKEEKQSSQGHWWWGPNHLTPSFPSHYVASGISDWPSSPTPTPHTHSLWASAILFSSCCQLFHSRVSQRALLGAAAWLGSSGEGGQILLSSKMACMCMSMFACPSLSILLLNIY